jgi:hypothetical protein
VVKVGADLMTGHPGIFAGGDMVPAERNVTVAVGHGKKAARTSTPGCAAKPMRRRPSTRSPQFEKLNPWYYADAPKTVRPMLDIIRRQSTFEEVQGGLDEATRCSRRGAASVAATASNATTATASAPTTP